ncbi:uncharacterized protein LOC141646760 isoform X1 [Silene latifolia]|uniref:uncharacterized protein LOC141646760 isoform X1 n=1 Tax=Silene latifolia TaxID=37657 RepID=UPI003D780288
MATSAAINEDPGAPESWEVADVEESMKRLLLSPSSSTTNPNNVPIASDELSFADSTASFPAAGESISGGSGGGGGGSGVVLSEDAINQVDQFLREALQNPRERLSVLRMEQDVVKFIRDPMRQQLEFQQLPTSYLRLAAHRVAQHYFLQSMVLLDNSLPDGSGSRIIVRKTTSECRFPRVRLADIPILLPQENSGAVKLAIKQRPDKYSPGSGSGLSGSQKANHSKTVEERKEEYNRARARIFNSANHNGSPSAKPEMEPKKTESLQLAPVERPKVDLRSVPGVSDLSSGRSVVDCNAGSSRPVRSRAEKDPVSRYRPSNRVAIFRDRDNERKDPDFDRSYDRYMQRFDPGFGFTAGPYTVQPMYTPIINYNTEFPQLGVAHRPQISSEPPRPHPQHLPGLWAPPSNPAGLGYGHPETMMAAYSPNHVNARPSTLYLHAPQYTIQPPGMPFIHPHEHISQAYQQSQQQQHDATLGLARPR